MSSNSWSGSEQTIPSAPPMPSLPIGRTLEANRTTSEPNITTNSYDISSNACALYWNHMTRELAEDFLMVSLYNDVESIPQSGPKCGLVALMMSQSLVSKSATKLNQKDCFDLAKDLGFTKTGEMFSVENMAKLVNRVLSVGTQIKVNLKEQIRELVIHLAEGLPVLVPYDSDANHEPTLLGGQRAHWAIVLGFCMTINESDYRDEQLCGFTDHNNRRLKHLTPKHSLPEFVLNAINNKSYKRFFVFAKQGKSKHLQIWDFNQLCESNCNLYKTSRKLNETDIVLPENGGIIKGLNNQCLFISNKWFSNDFRLK